MSFFSAIACGFALAALAYRYRCAGFHFTKSLDGKPILQIEIGLMPRDEQSAGWRLYFSLVLMKGKDRANFDKPPTPSDVLEQTDATSPENALERKTAAHETRSLETSEPNDPYMAEP